MRKRTRAEEGRKSCVAYDRRGTGEGISIFYGAASAGESQWRLEPTRPEDLVSDDVPVVGKAESR